MEKQREIKFRGKRIDNGEWVYGYYVRDKLRVDGELVDMIIGLDLGWYVIDPETLGQYTGLKDSKGKEIYEGDIVNGKVLHSYGINMLDGEEKPEIETGQSYISSVEWFGTGWRLKPVYKDVEYDINNLPPGLRDEVKIDPPKGTLGLALRTTFDMMEMKYTAEVIGNVWENGDLLV